MSHTEKIKEVAGVFLRLGTFAFGGPAAHIAMIEDEVVTKRKWMTREHFLDLVGATNLIPGPNSTEMAIHCGLQRAGWIGLITAGVCFILPAVVITMILAGIYVTYGTLPLMNNIFYGIRPAVLAIILSAVIKFSEKALKNRTLGIIGLCVTVAAVCGVNEITAILAGGIIGMLWLNKNELKNKSLLLFALPSSFKITINKSILFGALLSPVFVGSGINLTKIFFIFLKIGMILFGSGYVLIAYLQGELVDKYHWLTQKQLLDAIAVGQFTPGPVLSTATFVGYQMQGASGAFWATLGIFLPSFFFVALLNPLIPKMRKSQWMSKFLDAVNVSALGIMAAVALKLGATALADWKTTLIALTSIVIVIVYKKLNAAWLVVSGALAGYILSFI